jgi:predicted nucleic acid-binding Zn finger protein
MSYTGTGTGGDEMTTLSPQTQERVRRGLKLKLAQSRAEEFERVAPFVYRVPSCTGRERYTVDLDLAYCTCEDYHRHRERGVKDHVCKHMYAVEIVRAKRAAARVREAA